MEDNSKSQVHPPRWDRWLIVFTLFGIALRVFRYCLGLPIWGDEGFLGVNILDRSYRQLLHPLEYIQVAPIGFLWIERAMYRMFGMSEYIMRLAPALAGILAIVLFAIWARKILQPAAATFATAVLAVSDLSVGFAVELKPYSLDLLMSLALLLPATLFLMDKRDRWLVCLIVITPIALFVSLPSVFVAAGIGVTLILMLKRLNMRQRILTLAFAMVLIAGFLILVHLVIDAQFAGSGPDQVTLWAFPPRAPLKFIAWFFRGHTGNFFGYPVDLVYPWSVGSFALFLVGAGAMFASHRRLMAGLLLSPFFMTFVAAVLRKYPYGDSPRVGQHLVGPMCLLIGLGCASLIETLTRKERIRWLVTRIVLVPFVVGLVGPVATVFRPTSATQQEQANRMFVRSLFRNTSPNTTVVVLNAGYSAEVVTRWYLHEWPGRIVWEARVADLPSLRQSPLLVVDPPADPKVRNQIAAVTGIRPKPKRQHAYFGGDCGVCDVYRLPAKSSRP